MSDDTERLLQAIIYIRTAPEISRLGRMLDARRARLDEAFGGWHGTYRACHDGAETAKIARDCATFDGDRLSDLGSGSMNPFAAAGLTYVSGASSAVGLDQEGLGDEWKSARAVFDLAACLALPERWNISGGQTDGFGKCVRHFDLAGLRRCSI